MNPGAVPVEGFQQDRSQHLLRQFEELGNVFQAEAFDQAGYLLPPVKAGVDFFAVNNVIGADTALWSRILDYVDCNLGDAIDAAGYSVPRADCANACRRAGEQ